ncbi:hypothetical protein [Aquimarina litoralis]|uniref:hypothetical protein n=1 Tax=Aquimarina litoralis TaxID=584605 RepID=UPI001C58F053|nr:hypothetical protein [Aquimarina litoralis]MBW1293977.1 hypothetical protein [Aquimarina litoralis]
MKTEIFKSIRKIALASVVILFISCETDIPETDTTIPSFSFNISGDGFNRTFTQDDDFTSLQLNLRTDTTYDFIFSGADSGGEERTPRLYPHDYIEFSTEILAPWETTSVTFLSSLVYWDGNEANPTTGNILAGKLVTNGDSVSISFTFLVRDFGGLDGTSNTITKSMNIYIDDQNTEVILL